MDNKEAFKRLEAVIHTACQYLNDTVDLTQGDEVFSGLWDMASEQVDELIAIKNDLERDTK